MKVTPAGRLPLKLSTGEGAPATTIVNCPVVPTVKIAVWGLVIAGALTEGLM